MDDPLSPFNASARCPKCGNRDVRNKWIPQMDDEEAIGRDIARQEAEYATGAAIPPVQWRERIRRTCKSCEFTWDEAPLDAGSIVDQLGTLIEPADAEPG